MIDFLTRYWLPATVAGGALTLFIVLLRGLWQRLGAKYPRVLLLLACLLFLLPFAPLARLVSFPGIQSFPFTNLSFSISTEAPETQRFAAAEPAARPGRNRSSKV